MDDSKRVFRRLGLAVVGIVLLIVALVVWSRLPHVPSWVKWGVVLEEAPEGTPVAVASLSARELRRGSVGTVEVAVEAVYSEGRALDRSTTPLRRCRAELQLVAADDGVVELPTVDGWTGSPGLLQAEVELPDVPDGDYLLRAVVHSRLGEVSVDLPVDLYAPALVHLLTDRPMYQPGQEIRFRAVTFREGDLVPIEERPGRFSVMSPEGDLLLDEPVPTGAFGVAAASFPLADSAPNGSYVIRYRSGTADDTVRVQVSPFRLPVLEVKARTDRTWYAVGEQPTIRGSVLYRSGAPVADALVSLDLTPLSEDGSRAWPPPRDWFEVEAVRTDDRGAFSVTLAEIPDDLHDPARVLARVLATAPSGQRVSGSTTMKLSPTPVVAHVETELSDGLVPDFNNRVYVRVTTPDGAPLPGATVRVSRAWDPDDEGVTEVADEDAVAAVQLDPGQPVSVIVPPAPYRPAPRSETAHVRRSGVTDLFASGPVSVDENVVLDGWDARLEHCAWLVDRPQRRSGAHVTRRVGVAVAPTGTVTRVVHEGSDVDRCIEDTLRSLRGPTGGQHLYSIAWTVQAPEGGVLETEDLTGVPQVPEGLRQEVDAARRRARACIAEHDSSDPLPEFLHWTVVEGDQRVHTSWQRDGTAAGAWQAREMVCVREAFQGMRLPREQERASEGVVRLLVRADPSSEATRPSATVRTAYELNVAVEVEDQALGETTVVLDPGRVPTLRLRPERAILGPGEELVIQVLRGPSFHAELPGPDAEIFLQQGGRDVQPLQWDPEERVLRGTIPDDPSVHGLLTVQLLATRAVLLVPRQDSLELALSSDRPQYRPGETATLGVQTTAGGAASPAAVSLLGVDEALGQLTALPGPDEMGRVTIRATSRGAAFGEFDAEDLLMGRVRGANASLAALQRIQQIPTLASEERVVSGYTEAAFDPVVPLTETFYEVLADAQQRVTAWEQDAPEGELMTAARMAGLWAEMLRERRRADLPCGDAYGMDLELIRLPSDLLALTDPRLLVTDASRLPEDVENWGRFVREVSP